MSHPHQDTSGQPVAKRVGFWAGIIFAVGIQCLPVPEALTPQAWLLASLAVLMACWWASEAIPIAATALIPMALFPFFDIVSFKQASAPYASPIVMLLLGGFIVALAVEKWNLHARIALNVVVQFGAKPAWLILGFMVSGALLSMWISNTATTLMMIPIALKVADSISKTGKDMRAFAPALVLAIAYSCSVGGIMTPVGTPTNLIALGFLEETYQFDLSFIQWMAFGVPIAVIFIPIMWLILTQFVFKLGLGEDNQSAQQEIIDQKARLGVMTSAECRVGLAFGIIALLWMGRQLPGILIGLDENVQFGWNPLLAWISDYLGLSFVLSLSNAQIAIMGALALFLIPAGSNAPGQKLMNWSGVQRLPWDVIILFGGGLSLAFALQTTGLSVWIGTYLAWVTKLPFVFTVLIFIMIVVFLTELTSNVATISGFLPVLASIAGAAGVPPVYLIAPVAVAASCAFMLPVATAPNAIVFASGATSLKQMMRAGFFLNLAAALVITLMSMLLCEWAFGR